MTDGLAYQEIVWRVVCATLLVQAVWLVFSMTSGLSRSSRIAICAGWLLSAAVMFQAGTVMMAPLTALQMLVCAWLLHRSRTSSMHAGLIGLFWIASLFTAYQAVLFAPLVLMIVARMRISAWQRASLFMIPVFLLALYTLTNPLVPASMIIHAGKDASQTLAERFTETGWILVLGGSGILSILGTVGLFLKCRWEYLATLLLVTAYIFLSRYDYYAILFTPLFIVGWIACAGRMNSVAMIGLILTPLCTVALFFLRFPYLESAPLPSMIMERLPAHGPMLMVGYFGHEWQHASWYPVRRYHSAHLVDAQTVVCLAPCEEMQRRTGWERVPDLDLEVWSRLP